MDFRKFREAISKLTPREQKILEMRMGIKFCDHVSLKQICEEFGICPARVNVIEHNAIKKIIKNS